MAYSNLNIPDRLAFMETALKNAQGNPFILGCLEEYGYGVLRLQQGGVLLTRARAVTGNQVGETGDKLNLTAAKDGARQGAHEPYIRNLKLARQVVTLPGDRLRLELDGEREDGFDGWSRQVGEFYTQLLATDRLVQLLTAEFNLTREKLLAGQALYLAAVEAERQQTAQTGEKQNSTQQRDAVMAEVDAWMSKYQAAAEVTLADSPQLLESLGWFVRNAPRPTPPASGPEAGSLPIDPGPTPAS